LVEEIGPPDRLWAGVDSLLLRIRSHSLSSIRQTKKVIAACLQDPNLSEVRDRALPLVDSTKTEDFRKATQAFLKKRETG
jgi:enoyl-CoA hydratase/carnithine racemase